MMTLVANHLYMDEEGRIYFKTNQQSLLRYTILI